MQKFSTYGMEPPSTMSPWRMGSISDAAFTAERKDAAKAAQEVLASIPIPRPPLSIRRLICCQVIGSNPLELRTARTTLLRTSLKGAMM